MRLVFTAVALLFAVGAQASGCMMEMNGTWILKPDKSLDEGGPDNESLVFKNSETEQRYTMEYAEIDGEKGRLDWGILLYI